MRWMVALIWRLPPRGRRRSASGRLGRRSGSLGGGLRGHAVLGRVDRAPPARAARPAAWLPTAAATRPRGGSRPLPRPAALGAPPLGTASRARARRGRARVTFTGAASPFSPRRAWVPSPPAAGLLGGASGALVLTSNESRAISSVLAGDHQRRATERPGGLEPPTTAEKSTPVSVTGGPGRAENRTHIGPTDEGAMSLLRQGHRDFAATS
jgi:hypothetical protein